MTAKRFYWITGLVLVATIGHAFWRSERDAGRMPDPHTYKAMSPWVREAKFEELKKEFKAPHINHVTYFKTLRVSEDLKEALMRAEAFENDKTYDPQVHNMLGALNFFTDDYVNQVVYRLPNISDKERERIIEASGFENRELHYRIKTPTDPLTPLSWWMAYCALLALTFGHFVIRIEALGGTWWLAAISDWRFSFWLTLCPFGIFKYPTSVDVKSQLIRAYRFATLVLGGALTFAAAGCAGKRVKTGPDEKRVDDSKSWTITADTVTWPKYLGGDGAIFHPGPVQQSSVTAARKNGVYVSLWNSMPVGGPALSPNYGREIDFSGGWNGKVGNVNVGLDETMIDVTPLGKYRGNVGQFTAVVTKPFEIGGQNFVPSFTFRYAHPTLGETPGKGLFFREGLRWGSNKGRLSYGVGAEVFSDSGAFGFKPGWLLRSDGVVGLKLSSHWKIEAPFRLSTPLSQVQDGRRTEKQIGLRLAFVQ